MSAKFPRQPMSVPILFTASILFEAITTQLVKELLRKEYRKRQEAHRRAAQVWRILKKS
jgi:hypothetical protein